jgi:hypothetical protein
MPKYRVTPMESQYAGEEIPGNAIWGTAVKYLTHTERAAFRLEIAKGLLYDYAGQPFDTTGAYSLHSDDARAIFVMDDDGTFYASKRQRVGEFHHSSLVAGGPVAAAGEIEAQNGQLLAISDKSGHYRPGRAFTQQAIDELTKNGVDISKVKLNIVATH